MHSIRRTVTAAIAIACAGSALILSMPAHANEELGAWTIPAVADDPAPHPLPIRTNTKYAHRVLSAALKDKAPRAVTDVAPDDAQQVAITQGSIDSPSGGLYSLALGTEKGATHWPSGSTVNPTLTITNIGFSDLVYAENGLGAVWQIERQDGKVVFDSARGRIIPHFRLRHRLAPGQSQVFTAGFDLKDYGGHPLPAGQYILRGRPGNGLGISVETKITVDPPAQA